MPANGAEPKGCLVLASGRSEFIEKYFEVIGLLQTRGFNVATFDWRGQGLSERLLPIREKGHIPDFGVFRSDLALLTEEIAMKTFSGPYLLATHSMGGTPSLQLLADGYDKFSGAILCAPMTRLFPEPIKRFLVRLMSQIACNLGASRQSVIGVREYSLAFEGNALTTDRARHDRFRIIQETAPNATIHEPTYGWLRAAIAAMDDLHDNDRFAKLNTPVLIISAEDDRLVNTPDHAALAARSSKIENVVIKDALHEILMERDEISNQYWAHFDRFVEDVLNS